MAEASPRTLVRTIPPEWEGRTVRHYLGTELHISRTLISRIKRRKKGITRNGTPCRTDERLCAGDVLAVQVGDEGGGNEAEPIPAPLRIVYEDEDLAVIDKPAGLAVHGVPGGAPTLANAMAALWGPAQAFHPVHRLDRGTSGLMVAAKSAYVQELLRRALHTGAFRREYLALIPGTLTPAKGTVDLPIGREEGHPTRRQVRADGQSARTEYEILEISDRYSLLRLRPLTGRTHQLRVHMAALGHPLPGDALYGGDMSALSRPALHSARIELRHPVTGEQLVFTSPPPEEWKPLLL